MPIARFELPDGRIGRFEVPEGTTPEQAQAMIAQNIGQMDVPPEPKPQSGLMAAAGAGFRGGVGEAAESLGELTGLEGLTKYGKRQQAQAAKAYVPTSEADIEAASKRGMLPELGTYATQFLEPYAHGLAGIAARYGAPIAGGAAAAAFAPEAAAVTPFIGGALGEALGLSTVGSAVSTAGFAATNFPLHVGEVLTRQKEQGQPQDMESAITYGLARTAVDSLSGAILSGPMKGIIGKTAMQEAEALAPAVARGETTAAEASTQISGRLKNIAQATVQNAAVGTGMMVSDEALIRAAAGQGITDPDAIKAYVEQAKGAAAMAPLFGLMHGFGQPSAAKLALRREEAKRPLPEEPAPTPEAEAEAIPEPTLRGTQPETAAGTPEAQILKEAITPKKQAAMDKQLAKEQQEYLKKYQALAAQREADQAEKDRIAAMSPEEFAAEQMQGVGKKPKVAPVDQDELAALGYQTQPSFVSGEVDNYATQQLALVKDRELAPNTGTYVNYLLVNPELGRKIALSDQVIPGLSATQSHKVKSTMLSTLKLQDQAAAKAAADEQAAKQERGASLLGQQGAQANQELLGAARQTPAAQAQAWERGERERIDAQESAEKARIAKLTPEEYKAELSQVKQKELPEGEEPALMDENDPLLKQLVEALPRDNGRVLPGQVYEGLGGTRTARKDLQAQLATARITGNRAEMSRIKDQIDAGKERQEVGGFGKTAEAAKELGGNVTPESRAHEVKADQYADQQRSIMLGLVKLLNTRNPLNPGQTRRGATLSLPGVFEKRISDAKEAFIAAHANEIEARRAAFDLSPMADWERAEARARALEALNELSDRWGTFGAPVQAVGVLQQQVREATHQNLLNAAKRFNLETGRETQEKLATFAKQPQKYTNYKGEEINVPRETGPRIGAPSELTLKGIPRIPEDDRAAASKFIDTVLSQVERRTRAEAVTETKPAAKVGSLQDIAKLFEESKEGARSAKIDAATVEFLKRLQDHLKTSTDPEFASLARKQAQRVMEGNLPDPMAVRDLDEMMKAREVSGRSAAKPLSAEETAAVARGEKKYEAQPQKELFPEASVQTVRATPANFQRLLASKDIQGLRAAIAKQKADNLAALQAVGKEIPNLKNKLTKAEQNYKAKLAKAQKTTPDAKALARGVEEELKAANEALSAISQQYRFVSSQLSEIESMRNALLAAGESGTIDARFSLEANALMQQEKALRKQQEELTKQLNQAHGLVSAVEAFQETEKKFVTPVLEENEKANKGLAKAQEDLAKAKQERLGETRVEKLQAETERQKQEREEKEKVPEGERGTDLETYRQSLQRGREGLDLPGLRVEKDTTGMKDEIHEIRSEMGSLNELIADEKTTPEKRAEYEAKLEDAEERLASVYERAPRVTTELQSRDEERAMREYDDAQAAAYDEAKAKRAKRAGEKTERLVHTRGTALLKSVTGSAISQPRKPNKTVEVGEEVTDKLIEAKTKLAEIQRRITYLKDNNKHKVAGRLTDAFKDLQGKEQLQKQKLSNIQKRQSKIVAVEKEATSGYTKEKQKEALRQAEKEDERFARGVEVESPDLTDTQRSAIEENDITAAYSDIANDRNNTQINRVVAQRLATLLDATDIAIKDKLTDKDGKEVLGMATSKVIGLNRNGGLSQEVFLHEGVHAATERVLQLPESQLSKLQLTAKRELQALHAAIKNDPRITSETAKGSLSEFVAEVMSNRNLQEQLREKKWKLSDAWEGFKSIILRLLGIKEPETMLGAAIHSVDALMVPSSVELGKAERPVNRRLSQKDIAALHTGSNSMKQFADQFGQDIKAKDRTPEDVERIAKDYLKDMERSPDKYIAAPTEDSLDYKAQTKMPDGKFFDVNNPLHYVQADPTVFAALKALEDERLRVREAEDIRDQRETDLKSLIKLMRRNNSYTLAENALVAKAAAKYAVLSDKTGRLKLAEIADNNRHNVAVVSLDAADAVIRELRAGKNLKQAFLDGMQASADRAAKENERKDGWQKFEQGRYEEKAGRETIIEAVLAAPVRRGEPRLPGTRNLRLSPNQRSIIEDENNRRQTAGEPLLEKQGDIDPTINFLEEYYRKLEAAPNKNEDLAIKLSKGCAGTSWCTAGENTARNQLRDGDFYVYYKQGKPEVAVRMDGKDTIGEVRGNSPNQALNKEQQEIAEDFLRKQNFKNGLDYLDEFTTKEKLIKVAKGEAELSDEDIHGSFFDLFTVGGNVNTFGFKRLLSFKTVDGHTRIRPEPPADVVDFFAKKYKTLADSAYERGYLYFSKITASDYGLSKGKFTVAFGDKKFEFSPNEIKAVDDITLSVVSQPFEFSNLRVVNHLSTFDGEIRLPQAKIIKSITAFTKLDKEPARVVTSSNTFIGEIASRWGSSAHITVEGPKHIGEITLYKDAQSGLSINLPDTAYFKVARNFSFLSAFDEQITNQINKLGKNAGVSKNLKRDFDGMYEDAISEETAEQITTFGSKVISRFEIEAKKIFGKKVFDQIVEYGDPEINESIYLARDSGDPLAFVENFNQNASKQFENAGKNQQTLFKKLVDLNNSALEFKGKDTIVLGEAALNAPKRIADTPPIEEMVERTAEEPRYARRVAEYAPGFEKAGALAERLIDTKRPLTERMNAEAFGRAALEFETRMVDQFAPLAAHSRKMDSLAGIQMMHFARMVGQRMNLLGQAVGVGAPELRKLTRADGKNEWIYQAKSGANLAEVTQQLETANDIVGSPEAANNLFSLYTIAERAKSVGLNKLNYRLTQAELDQAMNQIRSAPGLENIFKRAAKTYEQFNRNMVQFGVDTGVFSKEQAQKMLSNADYVPYYRENTDGSVSMLMGDEHIVSVGNIKDQPYLHSLVGGDQRIADFTTSSVRNANMILEMGLRNKATLSAANELQKIGLAKIIEGKTRAGTNIVQFKSDGKDYFAIVESTPDVPADLLVKGMEGIPVQTSALMQLAGMPSRLLREMFVANPVSAGRILFKDTISSAMVAGSGFGGMRSALRNVSANLMERRGISGGEVFTGLPADLTKILREIQTGKPGWETLLAKANVMHAKADAMTRQLRYESYLQQGMSEMEATHMSLESMNFTRRGISPTIHMLNTLNPFINSQIQGVNTLVKALRGNMPMNEKLQIRDKIIKRGMLVAVGTMLYSAAMQDDETYKNALPEQKYNNWFVPFPGVDEKVRVPLPFEAGLLFKVVPESLVNYMYGHDKEAAAGMRMAMTKMIPGLETEGIPQILKPSIEAKLGKSFYTGRDIESRHEQTLVPGMRVRDTTSGFAAELGGALNVSPIIIDHLIGGYTGQLGLAVTQMASSLVFGPKMAGAGVAKRLSQEPIVGSLFQPEDAGAVVEDAYQMMTEAEQVKNTANDMVKQGRLADARAFVEKNAVEWSRSQIATKFTSEMGKIATMMQMIKAAPNLSPEEKLEKIDELKKRRNVLAEQAMQAANRTTPQPALQ